MTSTRRLLISHLRRLLEEEDRFDVKASADGRNAYDLVFEYKPDVIVLDINFGSQDIKGTNICSSIRDDGCQVPIILITKYYTQTDDVLEGFEKGADDYVRLPCDTMEIRARIKANLPQGIEEYDDYLRIDRESQRVCVKRNGEWQEVTLRPLQFRLLRELADNARRTIEYYKLADRVWGKEEMDEGAMFKCLCELRARVEPDPHHPIYLETIRGVGYRFNGRSTRAYGGNAKRRAPC